MKNKTDPELWRRLRIGDRIRLVAIPLDFLDWKSLHRETKQAYKYLLGRRRPVTVWQIDEYGMPWVLFRFREKNGRIGDNSLAVNHEGIVLVRSRPKSSRK